MCHLHGHFWDWLIYYHRIVLHGLVPQHFIHILWPIFRLHTRMGKLMTNFKGVVTTWLICPSHYLNQHWLAVNGVLWHKHKVSSSANTHDASHYTGVWKLHIYNGACCLAAILRVIILVPYHVVTPLQLIEEQASTCGLRWFDENIGHQDSSNASNSHQGTCIIAFTFSRIRWVNKMIAVTLIRVTFCSVKNGENLSCPSPPGIGSFV